MQFYPNVHSYKVATTVCLYALCNKLLISKKVKIRLERVDKQEEIIVETLLDSGTTVLKHRFKLEKLEHIIYKRHRERTEINVVGEKKQNVILEIPQLTRYNPEINQKIGEVNIMRCTEEYSKQQRSEERAKKEIERNRVEKEKKNKREKKGKERNRSNKGVEDPRKDRRSSKVKERSKTINTKTILLVNLSFWKESK